MPRAFAVLQESSDLLIKILVALDFLTKTGTIRKTQTDDQGTQYEWCIKIFRKSDYFRHIIKFPDFLP